MLCKIFVAYRFIALKAAHEEIIRKESRGSSSQKDHYNLFHADLKKSSDIQNANARKAHPAGPREAQDFGTNKEHEQQDQPGLCIVIGAFDCVKQYRKKKGNAGAIDRMVVIKRKHHFIRYIDIEIEACMKNK